MEQISRNSPVRVSLPASVASDITSLKKSVGSILDKLGCQACCSGHDILFELQRDVVFGRDLKSREMGPIGRLSAVQAKSRSTAKTVRVGVNPEFGSKIENVYEAIDQIADLTGHPACATGCDMFFRNERIFVMENLGSIQEKALTIG